MYRYTYINTYMNAYMHTYIHARIHTYARTHKDASAVVTHSILVCTAFAIRRLTVKRSSNRASEYYSPLSPAGILARGRDAPSLDGIAICRPPALVYMYINTCVYMYI